MMSRLEAASYSCADCGHASAQWFGRCPRCGSWSSAADPAHEALEVQTLGVAARPAARMTTGISEVDRVLGGGLVAGEAVLLAGEPGIGKSTLVLQLMQGFGDGGRRSLLITGEESLEQVALRASRLGLDTGSLRVAALASLDAIVRAVDREDPEAVIVDSIQTVEDDRIDGPAGSVVQVRDCAAALVRDAKRAGRVVVLVGQVTKDGAIAGPKTLEHMVDAVLSLEGERAGSLRLVRAMKNRFGSCEETGVFMMGGRGLEAVADPSALLVSDRPDGVSGSVVFPCLEGSRCLLVEMQALVAPAPGPHPRRVAQGIDTRRLALLIGVLTQRGGVPLGKHDVFASAAGGITVGEPAADLAVSLAVFSSAAGVPVPESLIAVGEVGLAGEVRRVPGIDRRLAEAARLGFQLALVPTGVERVPRGLQALLVPDIAAALAHIRAAAEQAAAGARRDPKPPLRVMVSE